MSVLLRIRHTIPLVKPYPFYSLKKRWLEKISVVKHSLGIGGAKTVGVDGGNIILKFNSDCGVALKGELLQLPPDNMIFQHIKVFGEWGGVEANFLALQIQHVISAGIDAENIVFIDMGANVGLVSVQTMRQVPAAVTCIAVEPIPFLVHALRFNMASLVPYAKIKVLPYALGVISGIADISVDPSNYGASSLNSYERGGDVYTLKVKVVSSGEFSAAELDESHRFIIKSDLEGYDCAVLSGLPDWVWGRIEAGVVEITADGRADLSNLNHLLAKLENFNSLSWEPDLNCRISIENIYDFWTSGKEEIRNLYFSK